MPTEKQLKYWKSMKGKKRIRKNTPTEKQLKYWRSMKGGTKFGFKKGHPMYSTKGQFKKGQIPHNFKGGNSIQYRRRHPERSEPEQCEVCGAFGDETRKRLCYDHDHETGKFRGWICQRCNTALGMVKDNAETLIALAEYLKKSRSKNNKNN